MNTIAEKPTKQTFLATGDIAKYLGCPQKTILSLIYRKMREGFHYWGERRGVRTYYRFSSDLTRFEEFRAVEWQSVLYQEIPEELLKQCRTRRVCYSKRREAAVQQISELLRLDWNDTLRWLDFHHAGWRGYYVGTPEERIAS